MSSAIYKLIWFILNILVDFLEIIYTVIVFVKCKYLLFFSKFNDNELKYIYSNKSSLKKIPSHIVVILSEVKKPNFHILSNIIHWSLAAGVNYISFYDHEDDSKDYYLQLYKYMSDNDKLNTDKIDWRFVFDYKSSQEKNGTRNKLHVNLIQLINGKNEIISLTKQLSYACKINSIKLNDITIELIDNKLNENLCYMPDPDIGLYFNNDEFSKCCLTYGLLPWQIRLTEFFCLGKQQYFTVKNFVNILYKYSKCEQRFGK